MQKSLMYQVGEVLFFCLNLNTSIESWMKPSQDWFLAEQYANEDFLSIYRNYNPPDLPDWETDPSLCKVSRVGVSK